MKTFVLKLSKIAVQKKVFLTEGGGEPWKSWNPGKDPTWNGGKKLEDKIKEIESKNSEGSKHKEADKRVEENKNVSKQNKIMKKKSQLKQRDNSVFNFGA